MRGFSTKLSRQTGREIILPVRDSSELSVLSSPGESLFTPSSLYKGRGSYLYLGGRLDG